MIGFLNESLGKQIVCVLSVIVVAVMAAIIAVTSSLQTSLMLSEMDRKNEEMILAIMAGIKYPMSQGHNDVIHRQMADLKHSRDDLELYICAPDGRIVFSTEPAAREGSVTDIAGARETAAALAEAVRTASDSPSEHEEEIGGKRYLSHIHVIRNSEECHRCHGASRPVIGAALMRMSTDRQYAGIADLRNSVILVTVAGIGAIIAIASLLLNRLVTRPVRLLAAELTALPEKIGQGTPVTTIDVARRDEIGMLQKSFHEMAWEMDKITNAMENANAELEHANQELESFAYSVSHDLRAPLRNIDGFSKILIDEFGATLDDRAKHYLNRVRNGTAKMSMLIDDILMFSRIGRTEMQFRVVRCAELVKSVIEYYAAEIEKRGVQINIGDLPSVNCDPTLMQSLLLNLISNALKYTRNVAEPKVWIGYEPAMHALFVRDNGIGFEMKYHDKIFQVFQRLQLPEDYEGTGIGLAIVKRIAERHHWRVSAQAEPDKGAVFYVEIPELKEEK
ncbi:MAG: hypothetical protein OHK006_23270 [Thermodesulfovibrionales bacterium]